MNESEPLADAAFKKSKIPTPADSEVLPLFWFDDFLLVDREVLSLMTMVSISPTSRALRSANIFGPPHSDCAVATPGPGPKPAGSTAGASAVSVSRTAVQPAKCLHFIILPLFRTAAKAVSKPQAMISTVVASTTRPRSILPERALRTRMILPTRPFCMAIPSALASTPP